MGGCVAPDIGVKPRVLLVGHVRPDASGGGVGNHMGELARVLSDAYEIAVFYRVNDPSREDLTWAEVAAPAGGARAFLFNHRGLRGTSFRERTRFLPAEKAFAEVLATFAPDLVHVHHVAWLSTDLVASARASGARVVVTVHDHTPTCARGQRYRPDDVACATVDLATCAACVVPRVIEAARHPESRLRAAARVLLGSGEDLRLLAEREARFEAMFDAADVVIAPSRDAESRWLERYPRHAAKSRVASPVWTRPEGPPSPRPGGAVLRVGFLGDATFAKGIVPIARAVAASDGAFELDVFGGAETAVRSVVAAAAPRGIRWRGRYAPEALERVLAEVDAVVVPSLWPETYGIVAREAAAGGRPVVVSRVGGLVDAVTRGIASGAPPGDADAWLAALRALPRGPEPLPVPPGIDEEWNSGREAVRAIYAALVAGGKTPA